MRIAALRVYPVKACRALFVDETVVGPLGLEHDRRYAFVGEDGRALTQREQPLLATVRPQVDGDALRLDFGGLIDLEFPAHAFSETTLVDVWGKRIPGHAAPRSMLMPAAEYLGTELRLVALDAAAQRSFADSRPVLVATMAMLGALNQTLDEPVGMERFRPNVVLEGDGDWAALRGNDLMLEREKPCGRCEVTTIDQASGTRCGPEPLVTLNERFDGNFGVYYRVTRPGRLRRGEQLQPG